MKRRITTGIVLLGLVLLPVLGACNNEKAAESQSTAGSAMSAEKQQKIEKWMDYKAVFELLKEHSIVEQEYFNLHGMSAFRTLTEEQIQSYYIQNKDELTKRLDDLQERQHRLLSRINDAPALDTDRSAQSLLESLQKEERLLREDVNYYANRDDKEDGQKKGKSTQEALLALYDEITKQAGDFEAAFRTEQTALGDQWVSYYERVGMHTRALLWKSNARVETLLGILEEEDLTDAQVKEKKDEVYSALVGHLKELEAVSYQDVKKEALDAELYQNYLGQMLRTLGAMDEKLGETSSFESSELSVVIQDLHSLADSYRMNFRE